jgi:hypothetical protein
MDSKRAKYILLFLAKFMVPNCAFYIICPVFLLWDEKKVQENDEFSSFCPSIKVNWNITLPGLEKYAFHIAQPGNFIFYIFAFPSKSQAMAIDISCQVPKTLLRSLILALSLE